VLWAGRPTVVCVLRFQAKCENSCFSVTIAAILDFGNSSFLMHSPFFCGDASPYVSNYKNGFLKNIFVGLLESASL